MDGRTLGSSGGLGLEELCWSRDVCGTWVRSVRLRCRAVARAEDVECCVVGGTGDGERSEPEEVLVRTARFDSVFDVLSRAMLAMDKRCCFALGSLTRLMLG